ncbi:MAG TPA: hypothetical protein PK899_12865, partial [Spirochaetota bacterium]|nr:hypothetical protein [Spirochaetota bacterium]
MLVLFMSLIFVLIDWWLLFIPRNKRYLVARKFLVVPWTIIANNFLFCMRLKVLGKEHLSKEKNSLFICNHHRGQIFRLFLDILRLPLCQNPRFAEYLWLEF